ncbi:MULTISPECIES: hypothetical protein [Novosphingobium]|uniref:Uncharacterized protein n=1 Tax=Novosphingobium pentaromativorans TaxID=205844 RepID=A0A2W5NQ18_9SPHN|nr:MULTISPECIES: hypothetical protein [Novosphingobium]PZQ54548.1 MAG: hypothetical protein DI555_10895 [Novosphingobium pentaromativorans]GFE76188.1 hypothetical protein NTCA1_38370 [Novosphingobium sp. TCA1]
MGVTKVPRKIGKSVGKGVSKAGTAVKNTAVKAKDKAVTLSGPSPNTATNLAIADIALRGGTFLARRAMEHALLGKRYTPEKAKQILRGRSFTQSMVHTIIARAALGSVPGAALVVGGLAAKTLFERSRARKERARGESQIADMAEEGEGESDLVPTLTK